MKFAFLSFYFTLFMIPAGFAQQATTEAISHVGKHFPIFVFEKSENPENIMIVYTKLDENCRLALDSNEEPIFDFYWLMNRKTYKPTHPLIKSNIRERLEMKPSKDHNGFQVELNDFKELKADIQDAVMTVTSDRSAVGNCEIKATFKLGSSDNNAVLELQSIYSSTSKTFLPPFQKLKSITLRGVDISTGQKKSRTYLAK